jgi:hypothetical protein
MSEMQLDLGNMAPATAPGFLTAAFGLVWAFLLLGVVREILRATPQVM